MKMENTILADEDGTEEVFQWKEKTLKGHLLMKIKSQMDHYSKEQLNNIHKKHWLLSHAQKRPCEPYIKQGRKKNAIHPHMVNELVFALNYAHLENTVPSCYSSHEMFSGVQTLKLL